MPASNDEYKQATEEEFVQLDLPFEVERIPPRLIANKYSLAPEDDGRLEGGGFFYENCTEVFLGRNGYGPLRIAWDTNILIDYAEFGDLIWGPEDDEEYEFDPPISEVHYRKELVALYTLVQLWMMRDIRIRAPRRQVSDAQRELSESQWEIRATQLHHFLAAVQCTLLDEESLENVSPFPALPEGSNGDEWDASLVSEAVATGCHVFLTRDDRLRRRLSSTARESFLVIMSPSALVKALEDAGELGWGGEGYMMPDNHKWLHFMKATKHGEEWHPEDTMQDPNLQVQIDKWASSEEVRAVEKAFRRAGLEADVRAGVIDLSQQLTWIVIASIPPSAFLTAYFGSAGADAWKATKGLANWVRRFVRDLKDARGGDQEGTIELQDAGRTWLLLTSDLPEEAYRQLETVDWSAAQDGSLKWDNHVKCWVHFVHGKDPQQVSKPRH